MNVGVNADNAHSLQNIIAIINASIYWFRPQVPSHSSRTWVDRERVCGVHCDRCESICSIRVRYRSKPVRTSSTKNPMNPRSQRQTKNANMKCSFAAGSLYSVFSVQLPFISAFLSLRFVFVFVFGWNIVNSNSLREFILNPILVFGSHSVFSSFCPQFIVVVVAIDRRRRRRFYEVSNLTIYCVFAFLCSRFLLFTFSFLFFCTTYRRVRLAGYTQCTMHIRRGTFGGRVDVWCAPIQCVHFSLCFLFFSLVRCN